MNALFANRVFQIFLLLALLCVAVVFSFSDMRWREQIRNFTFDNYNILKPRVDAGAAVIVDIDEASLKAIGQMPWPRDVMADLVTKLKDMGAKVIAFDIVFPEPDRASPSFVAHTLEGVDGFSGVAEKLGALPDNDALFGAAIRDAGNVVTGFSFTDEKTSAAPAQKGIFRGRELEKFVPRLVGATVNLKEIVKDAAGNGSFFVSTDTDGIIRRVPMLVGHERPDSSIVSIYPALALEAIRIYDGQKGGRVLLADPRYAALDPQRFGVEGIEIGKGGRVIPTNARGEFIVHFAQSNPGWYVPAHKILDGTAHEALVRDKIVLVGTSAVGLKDIRSTPLDTFIPGVEVHLNIIDQIFQGQFLSRPIEAQGAEAVSIFILGIFIIFCSSLIGAAALAMIVIAVIVLSVFAGWYAFIHYGLLIDVMYPSLCVMAMFMLSSVFSYMRTECERRAVRQAFGLYISPDFMKELTRDPEKLRLGGESRELTVMFTDIRSFTGISESMPPDELIHLMNGFLTPMSDLVMHNRGTIDKYMGDAMMAFWNAPLDDPDHARHACKSALGMQAALQPINAEIAEKAKMEGREPFLLQAGIGINTGICAVGNMGSKQRFAYSALGDAVNLASRLEGQTKQYGLTTIIGESTRDAVPDFATLEVDLIRVKGKNKPVRIFTLLGDDTVAQQEHFLNLRILHEKMIGEYRSGQFKKARNMLAECEMSQVFGLAAFYSFYKKRLDMLVENPPSSWDGIYEAITK